MIRAAHSSRALWLLAVGFWLVFPVSASAAPGVEVVLVRDVENAEVVRQTALATRALGSLVRGSSDAVTILELSLIHI